MSTVRVAECASCRTAVMLGRHDAALIRFREPVKQGLQLLFTCLLPFQPTAQPPH